METVVEQIDDFERSILENQIKMAEVDANLEAINNLKSKAMKTINVEKEKARFESIMKSQLKCREYLHKLAENVHNLQRLTGMLSILFILVFSVNAQVVKTNFIGKTATKVKSSMNDAGMRFYNTSIDNSTGKLFTSYVDQYFGTIIYTFNKNNVCESYKIKSSTSHEVIVLTIINREFPNQTGNNRTNGTYIATIENSNNVLTVCVK